MIHKRTILGQQILYLMAGHETETVFLAQADALATSIGGLMSLKGHSLAEAEALADELAAGIKAHVRANWELIETADAPPAGSAARYAGGLS